MSDIDYGGAIEGGYAGTLQSPEIRSTFQPTVIPVDIAQTMGPAYVGYVQPSQATAPPLTGAVYAPQGVSPGGVVVSTEKIPGAAWQDESGRWWYPDGKGGFVSAPGLAPGTNDTTPQYSNNDIRDLLTYIFTSLRKFFGG
jgi:hypothetical protein